MIFLCQSIESQFFVNGCFWHEHENYKYFCLPKNNIKFWSNKIEKNKKCDKKEQCQFASKPQHIEV